MKIETIKEAVDRKFNLDIALKTRQRNYIYAKKVFSKLAYESGATFREVGDIIKKSHCNILHHVNSINVIGVEDKKKHDEIITLWPIRGAAVCWPGVEPLRSKPPLLLGLVLIETARFR